MADKDKYERWFREYIGSYIAIRKSNTPNRVQLLPDSLAKYYTWVANRYTKDELKAEFAVKDAWMIFFKKIDENEIDYVLHEEEKKLAERWRSLIDDQEKNEDDATIVLTEINDQTNKVTEEKRRIDFFDREKFIAWKLIKMVYSMFYEFVKNKARGSKQKNIDKATTYFEDSKNPGNYVSTELDSINFDVNQLLERKMDGLKENQKECLRLHYWGGYTGKEIAEKTGYSQSKVEGIIERGRKKLLESFENIGIEGLNNLV